MIAGYPTGETDIEVAQGLIDGGCGYLEVQFPFSDPSADGVPIQMACVESLEGGFRVRDGFSLIRKIREISDVPVFIMGYGSIVYARGIQEFVEEAAAVGAAGLIIPDLMPSYDEGLFEAGRSAGVSVVPVLPPGLSEERILEILALDPAYVYASLRVGITGSRTSLDREVFTFLERLRGTGRQVLAGFGIQTYDQVAELRSHTDVLVIGSALVRAIGEALASGGSVYAAAKAKVVELLGGEDSIEAETTD
jgi:tryptophan synthase alpha chain